VNINQSKLKRTGVTIQVMRFAIWRETEPNVESFNCWSANDDAG